MTSSLTEVDSTEFRRYVVRIEDLGGTLLGSGFFVAPGWTLTCAHVVRDRFEVALVGDEIGRVVAHVAGRSQSPPPGWPSEFWPFPDLALLRFDVGSGHACVLLDAGPPSVEVDCYAWGFPRREEGVAPVGSAMAARFQGIDGDGFLSLARGMVHAGLSGAPLLCPWRRAVVGVVAVTRDRRGDRGGWAAPISALHLTAPAIPDDLAVAAAEVLGANRRAVVARREEWQRVVPVTGADELLDATWAPFVRGPYSQPSQLLIAEHMVVPYMFRGDELARLEEWCNGTEPIGVAVVPGRGGAGKTRLAVELCVRMRERGWVAGFWRDDAATVPLPRLVVVDYAEAVADLGEIVMLLRRSATDIGPVRLLLLTRTVAGSADPLDALRRHAALQHLADHSVRMAATSTELTLAQRQELYKVAVERFAEAWSTPVAPSAVPDLATESSPLGVLVAALDAALDADGADGASPAARFARLLAHEDKYWRVHAPSELDSDTRRLCVALATLAGAERPENADALLALVDELAASQPLLRKTRNWLAQLYDGSGFFRPLRPDRVGEHLVASVLHQRGPDAASLVGGVLALSSDDQVVRALQVLARVKDLLSPLDEEAVAGTLLNDFPVLVNRAVARARGSQLRRGSADLVSAVAANATFSGADIATLVDDQQRSLSRSLTHVADAARSAGQGATARRLYRQAVGIDERLYAANPDEPTNGIALAFSLGRLGELSSEGGDVATGRSAVDRALHVGLEVFARHESNAVAAMALATTLGRLGDLERDSGDPERARVMYESARDLIDECTRAFPDIAELGMMRAPVHERLGDIAYRSGNRPGARAYFEAALAIWEGIARVENNNDDVTRGMTVSLERLADLARDAGDIATATEYYERSLGSWQTLHENQPDNAEYAAGLTVPLNRLGRLALAAGDATRAADLYERALAIRMRLAEGDPDNTDYQRRLGVALDNLAGLATVLEDFRRAGELYEQSFQITARLAEAEPENVVFQRDLAVSLMLLGGIDARCGALDDARNRFARALAICERLITIDPGDAVYDHDVAQALKHLAWIDIVEGDFPVARDRLERVMTITERLARTDPDNAAYRDGLLHGLLTLARLDKTVGDLASAEARLRRYQEIAGGSDSAGAAELAEHDLPD